MAWPRSGGLRACFASLLTFLQRKRKRRNARNGRRFALVVDRAPSGPPSVPGRPGRDQARRQGLVRGGRLHRGRMPGAAGVARQRGASARLRHREGRPRRQPAAALSPHLAGVHGQEAARRRREPHLRFRPRLPQPREGGAAFLRVHAARMVPGERALRATDGRRGGADAARRHDARPRPLRLARPHRRSLRRTGKAHRRRGLCPLRRHRSARNAHRRSRRARPRRPRGAGRDARLPRRRRRQLDRHLFPRPRREHRAQPRHGQADHLLRIPGLRGRPLPPGHRRSAPCRALRALCLRRRARQRLRRADRPGRAAPPLHRGDGHQGAHLRRALPARRGLPRRPRPHARGLRHRAGLRAAGGAGQRRPLHRGRSLGPGLDISRSYEDKMSDIVKSSLIIGVAIFLHGLLTGGSISSSDGFTSVKLSSFGTVSLCNYGQGCKNY
ncbi:putative Uncharacterized 50.6 kDa protein in the 5'region of gyrA and gyrB [uncultured Pleomorphomonas sp.]|uniref:Putative Uncharacterized 50.6 kDa protein in the 5'region of gyrA and gyrB n=1 Tax=uncultured Pleomorphomonas sp. TaxID=442121 RepID=A0A212L3A5_9HYPH|nr:putative Uncharacterized 50.6 kDa protein in the 5'region of gyrA and gyrB [uncultured Pleomorphomonas sp.]